VEGRSLILNPVFFFSIIEWLIIAFAFAGLAISLYFTLAYYGRIKKSRWIPEILCAREGSSCVTVVETPYARVFGIPNSLLGIIYYVVLIIWAGANRLELEYSEQVITAHFVRFEILLLPISLATVVLGFYLVYALRRKLLTGCPLCYAAHAINLALFALVNCDVILPLILAIL